MEFDSENSSLTDGQIAAILAARRLAKQLVSERPEIADDYRNGLNQKEIVEKYGLDEVAQTARIARTAVSTALQELIEDDDERAKLAEATKQRNGRECLEQGKGIHGIDIATRQAISSKVGQALVMEKKGMFGWTDEQKRQHGEKLRDNKVGIHGFDSAERRRIGQQLHTDKRGIFKQTREELSANGRKARELGVGIHAMSHAKRSELAKKTMAAGKGVTALSTEELRQIGKKTHREGKGVHGLSHDDHVSHGKKSHQLGVGIHSMSAKEKSAAGQSAALSRGQTPWENHLFDPETGLDEHHYCLQLLADPQYQIQRGRKTLTNSQAIADKLNETFHGGKPVRNNKSVSMFKFQKIGKQINGK